MASSRPKGVFRAPHFSRFNENGLAQRRCVALSTRPPGARSSLLFLHVRGHLMFREYAQHCRRSGVCM